MLNGEISKEQFRDLLEKPLDPNLDYFDATASIEAMAEHIRGLHKLIRVMFESLTIQGQSMIRAHETLVEIKADLLAAGIASTKDEDEKLVGFDKSSIIMPPNGRSN